MADQGIRTAGNNIVISPAGRQVLADASTPRGTNLSKIKPNIENLNKFQTRCILIQLSSLESNINANTINIGVPKIGTFRANINANTVVSHANTYFSNVAAITITNSDHSDIQLGMVANIQLPSTGAFGSNTMVIKKSVGGNIGAGNFVSGFTYTITSIGTTDFTLCGLEGNVANVVVGNVFVANSVGAGTGTAFLTNNQIMLGSDHAASGDIQFNVSPLKLGKYQTSDYLLTRYGYKNTDGSWATKDGVDSNDIFLQATEVQDAVMTTFLQEQYLELVKQGAIRDGDTKETIAGMLALAYQYQDLGNPALKQNVFNLDGTVNVENYSIASRANVWRNTGQTVDSQGRPGHIYFNAGRYAVRTLGADVPE
jgi:hypothetical protein